MELCEHCFFSTTARSRPVKWLRRGFLSVFPLNAILCTQLCSSLIFRMPSGCRRRIVLHWGQSSIPGKPGYVTSGCAAGVWQKVSWLFLPYLFLCGDTNLRLFSLTQLPTSARSTTCCSGVTPLLTSQDMCDDSWQGCCSSAEWALDEFLLPFPQCGPKYEPLLPKPSATLHSEWGGNYLFGFGCGGAVVRRAGWPNGSTGSAEVLPLREPGEPPHIS